MTTEPTDSEQEILAEIERDAEPRPHSLAAFDAYDPADAWHPSDLDEADPSEFWALPDGPHSAAEWGGPAPTGPTSPTAADAAWWQGYTAARDEFEAEVRDLEYAISRLETQVADYRAELMHRA